MNETGVVKIRDYLGHKIFIMLENNQDIPEENI